MRTASTRRPIALCLACGVLLWAGLSGDNRAADPAAAPHMERYVPTAEELQASYQRAQAAPPRAQMYKARVEPHWFHDSTRLWYRNDLAGGAREFIVVDAEAGKREPAFDHKRLAAALSKAAGQDYTKRLPFETIEFIDNDKAIRFPIDKTTWKCDLSSYECSKSDAKPQPTPADVPAQDAEDLAQLESPWPDGLAPDAEERTVFQQPQSRPRPPADSVASPDKTGLSAFIKDSNVYLRDKDGNDTLLTLDGKAGSSYGLLSWSPDAKWLAAFRIERAEPKPVYLIESSPRGGGRAQLRTRGYMLPGDKFTSYQPILFDVADRKQITPEVESAELEYGTPPVHWKQDGKSCTFTYQKEDRGHQRFRLIDVDPTTGKSRNLIDEKTQTFIWTAHTEGVNARPVTWVNGGKEIIYTSERDGWRHLYLIDARDGTVKNEITNGPYVVRGIDRIDEDKRQVWFRASGMNADQDPYFNHYYRINFDGSGLVALTEGNGDHLQGRGFVRGPRKPGQGPPPGLQFSPDRRFYIDTYSRVDMAPVHELRRSSDGHLVCKLEEADISELKSSGWEPPEVFVAKGRDGTTDIWGIICRPAKFDPNKKYPVIEYIYAGPHGSHVPKTFAPVRRFASLTELGFIVVQIDGMGTANRSKAFHDVCWHNLKDAGFPDRILWHKAAAAKYPYYDISRVGIYGTSAGGQNSTGALLFHGDFYKAAVSACGCHDNRMDKASWNEQWMGYPVGPQYAESSNIDHARNLTGKLLLIVGELDTNVPPESTLRLVDALIKANKDFEFVVMPGLDHTSGGAYGNRRLQDFFVRHLHGVTPPDRNVTQ
jgi:dipeptidyl aminopeptidase/acylaminoacyl peptidase